MVTMTNCGITITVYPSDVEFYKRAGYSVVDKAAPIEPVAQDADPAGEVDEPVKKTGKKN